jgi:iron complex outermembrane receptor protein
MDYRNQLILTGQLNDVGASLRTNVPESYRRGVELLGKVEMIKKVWFEGNVSFSDNRIKKFTDVYYDYLDFSEVRTEYTNTPIAYSPNVILFGSITDKHIKDCQMTLSYKYVGKQYLDNTGNSNHIIKPFGLFDFVAQKQVKVKGVNSLSLKLMVNNLLGVKYSNNGYTFKYAYSGTLVEERFFYPQALRNFLIGLEFKL